MRAVWKRVAARSLSNCTQRPVQRSFAQVAQVSQANKPPGRPKANGARRYHPTKSRKKTTSPPKLPPGKVAEFESYPKGYKSTLEGEVDLNGPVTFRLVWGGNDEHNMMGLSTDRRPDWQYLRPVGLRDMCTCAMCRDTSSGQKKFRTTQIPIDISVRSAKQTEEGLTFTFNNEVEGYQDRDHETAVPWVLVNEWLDTNYSTLPPLLDTGVQYPWTGEELQKSIRRFDYNDYMTDSETMWNAIIDLRQLGITIIKNVPRDENSVVDITTRIAHIKETFYGRTFDVKAKPSAENIAYTNEALDLHQDLLYLQVPPKIQVLHCMDNSCQGGETLFSDGYRAARLLWDFIEVPFIKDLLRSRMTYIYDKNGHNYSMARTVFSLRSSAPGTPSRLDHLWWSPAFQGGPKVPSWDYRGWVQGAKVLEQLISDPSTMWTYKLEEGECVLFDNVRVLHGRKAFDTEGGGSRWFRGAYIAPDDFASRARQIPQPLLEEYESGRFKDVAETRKGFVLPWAADAPENIELEKKIKSIQAQQPQQDS